MGRVTRFTHKWFLHHSPKLRKMNFSDPRTKVFDLKGVFKKFKSNTWLRMFATHGDNITSRGKDKWRFMGRAKRFNIYSFFTEGFSSHVTVKEFDFTKVNLRKRLEEVNTSNYKEKGFLYL
jgi:hypothetical protein